jgi:hypothetical protein
MTQKIADLLIKWYEDTINIIKFSDLDTPYSICVQRSTQRGICYCFAYIFNYNLAGDEWIHSKCKDDLPYITFWYEIPDYDDTQEQIIHKLQFRIDILKQYPN